MKPLLAATLAGAMLFGLFAESHAERRTYTEQMAFADELALFAFRRHVAGVTGPMPEVVAEAVAAYERAALLDPTQGEPHYRAAEVINAHRIDEVHSPERKDIDRAVAQWRAYEKKSPRDPRLRGVLSRRAIALTKAGGDENYKLALADYDRAFEISTYPDGTLLGNTAELYMLAGNLDQALLFYERALDLRHDPVTAYGLGLALWRAGHGARALELVARFAKSDRMEALLSPGVFFVPDGEIYAYRALGYEALGQKAAAIAALEKFLDSEAGRGRYGARAREHLRELKRGKR